MRNKLIYFTGLTVLTAIYAATPAAAPTPAPVTFPTYGFSINAFDTPTDGPVLQALSMSWPMMAMPSNNKFAAAPQVNVIVWPGNDDMGQYETRESLDLKMKGFSIVHDEKNTDNTEWRLEYVGISEQGVGMHWYAHVVRDTGTKKRIFIATGSAPDEMWGQFGAQIKACVDSLKATGTSQIAPTVVPVLTVSQPASAASTGTVAAKPAMSSGSAAAKPTMSSGSAAAKPAASGAAKPAGTVKLTP